jgi:hypothetical protein
VIVVIVVVSLLAALLVLAVGNDLYWRRRGFRTEIRGRGGNLTRVRVPIDDEHPPGDSP